jgi:Flp pilus assembly protein TadG
MRDNPSPVTHIHRRLRAQSGTAIVEMALVLPILLFLALGIVDFGRAINYSNDVNQIAADGARYAAVNKNPGMALTPQVTDFRQWLRNQADTSELKDGTFAGGNPANCPDPMNTAECSQSVTTKLKVCVESPTGQPLTVGNPIRVRVESSYNLIPFLDEQNTFGSIAIKGQAVMRLEQNYAMATGCTS